MDRVGEGIVTADLGIHSGVLGEGEEVLTREVDVAGGVPLSEVREPAHELGDVIADGHILDTEVASVLEVPA